MAETLFLEDFAQFPAKVYGEMIMEEECGNQFLFIAMIRIKTYSLECGMMIINNTVN
jgi:hypothetical protein